MCFGHFGGPFFSSSCSSLVCRKFQWSKLNNAFMFQISHAYPRSYVTIFLSRSLWSVWINKSEWDDENYSFLHSPFAAMSRAMHTVSDTRILLVINVIRFHIIISNMSSSERGKTYNCQNGALRCYQCHGHVDHKTSHSISEIFGRGQSIWLT